MLEYCQIKNTPVDSNCFVLYDTAMGDECIIIDPGSLHNEELKEIISENKISPSYIILTHEHFDHCWGVEELRLKYPQVKLVCSTECSNAIQNRKRNHSVFYQQPGFELREADIKLEDVAWHLKWLDKEILFFPALGHTSSGVIFICGEILFTGDELIKDIRTVTKLKTGSKERLAESVSLISSLKGRGLLVCAGHGENFELDNYDINKAFG